MNSIAGIQSRVLLFLNENEGWEKTISSQTEELPVLEEMIQEREVSVAGHAKEKAYFQEVLGNLKTELRQLHQMLKEQQERLQEGISSDTLYNFDALCSQDILRDRIRAVQQRFIELKCNFLRYLSGVI